MGAGLTIRNRQQVKNNPASHFPERRLEKSLTTKIVNMETDSQTKHSPAEAPACDGEGFLSKDLLGVNRKGDSVLCVAWGESDVPSVAICRTADEIRKFFIDEWFGDPDEPDLKDAMDEVAEHDWLDGALSWQFEIGGIKLRDVCDKTPNSELSGAERPLE